MIVAYFVTNIEHFNQNSWSPCESQTSNVLKCTSFKHYIRKMS
jgi:hypothetical protein